MENFDTARLIYLVILGTVIAGWFITQNRHNWGKTLQYAAAWALIFVGAIAVVGLWQDIRGDLGPPRAQYAGSEVSVPRAYDGHYYLILEINGVPVEFAVDTGATDIVLSPRDARRIGIDTDSLAYLGTAYTANGTVGTARVKLDNIQLGNIRDDNVVAYVNEAEMGQSLLGMAYLNRFDRISIEDNRLVLSR